MEVREGDDNRLLQKRGVLHDLLTEASYPRPGVNDADVDGVLRGNEETAGAAPEFVELRPVHRNRAAASVNYNPDLFVIRIHALAASTARARPAQA